MQEDSIPVTVDPGGKDQPITEIKANPAARQGVRVVRYSEFNRTGRHHASTAERHIVFDALAHGADHFDKVLHVLGIFYEINLRRVDHEE